MSDTIPALFVTSVKGETYSGDTLFDGSSFRTSSDRHISSIEELRGGKNRQKALLIDSVSLSERRFNAPVVSMPRISGCDIWLAETIRDLEDLTDAFLGNMRKLVIPVHTLDPSISMRDVSDVSDSCIPMICCRDGRPIGKMDLNGEVDSAFASGFDNVVVMDYDGTLLEDDIRYIADEYPGMILFSPAKPVEHVGITAELIGGYSVSPRCRLRSRLPRPQSRLHRPNPFRILRDTPRTRCQSPASGRSAPSGRW